MKSEGVTVNFYLGIDGGGSSLKALLGDENKKIIGAIKSGPVNYQSAGLEKTKANFASLFNYCENYFKVAIGDIKCICLGCAGANNKQDKMIYANMIKELGYKGKLLIYNDAYIALVGANGEAKGAVLISGTGSIAYGISKDGKHVRVGGWGHIIGDEGSGYAIGRDALNAITRSIDGIIPQTKLTEAILNKLNISNLDELITFVYDPNTQKQHIAELSPIVIEKACEDRIAAKIVDDAVNNLWQMVYGLKIKMDMDSFNLSLSGSILTETDVIRKKIIKKLNEELPQIQITMGKYKPDYGALTIAWAEAAI